MPDTPAYQMFTYTPDGIMPVRPDKPLVKLANVIKPVPPPKPAPLPASSGVPGDENANSVLWSYKADPVERKKDDQEKDHTPGFDFSEKVSVEGKERKIELAPSGLYVFDKKEKFDKPAALPMQYATAPQKQGMWIGVKKPFSDGKILVPLASKPSDFKTVSARGRTIRGILELTKKTK